MLVDQNIPTMSGKTIVVGCTKIKCSIDGSNQINGQFFVFFPSKVLNVYIVDNHWSNVATYI